MSNRIAGAIDKNIGRIAKLTSAHGHTVNHLDRYIRQYGGIVVDGHKFVYINAFARSDTFDPSDQRWRSKAEVWCDGDAWGAVYDPATGTFSHLAINNDAWPRR